MPRTKTTWVKGQSGNPKGWRANLTVPKHVTEAAQTHSDDAIKTLAKVMMDKKEAASVRVHCADVLLNRAWGRPKESIEVNASLDLVGLLAGIAEQRLAENQDGDMKLVNGDGENDGMRDDAASLIDRHPGSP
jgi:hypothetical protein